GLLNVVHALTGLATTGRAEALAAAAAVNGKLSKPEEKALLEALAVRDPEAPALDEPDPDLRDQENVPLPDEPVTFEPETSRRLVHPGDTIVSTVRTYLRAVWPVTERTDDLVVSTGFAVLSPRSQLNPGFLGWSAQSDALIEEIVARSVGVSYPAITAGEIGD